MDVSEEEFFRTYPRPYSEYTGGPAVILTVTLDSSSESHHYSKRNIRVKLEEITSSDENIVHSDSLLEYPLDWIKEKACEMGFEKKINVYGRDLVCNFSEDK